MMLCQVLPCVIFCRVLSGRRDARLNSRATDQPMLLVIYVDGSEVCSHAISGRKWITIGRSQSCGLVITHPRLSSTHCRMSLTEQSGDTMKNARCLVEDLSRNGTFVNGVKVGQNNHESFGFVSSLNYFYLREHFLLRIVCVW